MTVLIAGSPGWSWQGKYKLTEITRAEARSTGCAQWLGSTEKQTGRAATWYQGEMHGWGTFGML